MPSSQSENFLKKGMVCYMRYICAFLSFLASFFTGVLFSDLHNLQVKEYKIRHNRIKKPVRFVYLSDLHGKQFGPGNAKLLNKIDEAKPDFVVVGGDLITTKFVFNYKVMEQLIKDLSQKYKVFYAMGNHEAYLGWDRNKTSMSYESLCKVITEAGAEILDNQSSVMDYYGIKFTGLNLGQAFYDKKHMFMLSKNHIEELVDTKDAGQYNILLAHNPEYFDEYSQLPYNLVLSGHMHGGVMRLPEGKGAIDPRFRLFRQLCWGSFIKNGTRIIVSRGLAMHTIPIRIFNPSELTVVTLKGPSKRPDQIIKRIMKKR